MRSRPGPRAKSTCHCGAPRRPGGNHCPSHHAEAQRRYRAGIAAELARLAELERRHA
jgi:hypothetical protein